MLEFASCTLAKILFFNESVTLFNACITKCVTRPLVYFMMHLFLDDLSQFLVCFCASGLAGLGLSWTDASWSLS